METIGGHAATPAGAPAPRGESPPDAGAVAANLRVDPKFVDVCVARFEKFSGKKAERRPA